MIVSSASSPVITRRIISNLSLNIGQAYIITSLDRNRKRMFTGTLVDQTDNLFILRHHKHGYTESFMKVDFMTGVRKLKEA